MPPTVLRHTEAPETVTESPESTSILRVVADALLTLIPLLVSRLVPGTERLLLPGPLNVEEISTHTDRTPSLLHLESR